MSVLAINSGSSSLKFGLFDAGTVEALLAGGIDWAQGDRARAQFTLRPRKGRTVTAQVAVPDDFTAARLALNAAVGLALPAQTRDPAWPWWATESSTVERSFATAC